MTAVAPQAVIADAPALAGGLHSGGEPRLLEVRDGLEGERRTCDREAGELDDRERRCRIRSDDHRGEREERCVGKALREDLDLTRDGQVRDPCTFPADDLILVPRQLPLECAGSPEAEREDAHSPADEDV